jgi:hypothetical protein
MIKSYYDNLFLGFYSLNKRLLPKSEQPVLNSLLIVSLLLFCNISSGLAFIDLTTDIDILKGLTSGSVVVLMLLLLIINSLVFVYRRRYKKILLNANARTSERWAVTYLTI